MTTTRLMLARYEWRKAIAALGFAIESREPLRLRAAQRRLRTAEKAYLEAYKSDRGWPEARATNRKAA